MFYRGFALLAFVFCGSALAADITSVPLKKSGEGAILIEGTITAADRELFLTKISPFSSGVVILNSDGGNAYAGIEIGKAIRMRGFKTWVPSGSSCASACAIAWLGGTTRLMGKTALIGFHSVYKFQDGAPVETGAGNAMYGAYLAQLGLSDRAIYYLSNAAPSSMNWLTPVEAENFGISLAVFDTIGRDQQGSSRILLKVDTEAVRKEMLEALRDDVRHVLRSALFGYTGLLVRGNSVEVRIRKEADYDPAVTKLRDLSAPLGGFFDANRQQSLDITTGQGALIRITLTAPAMVERVRQSVDRSVQVIERRVKEFGVVGALVQSSGADRILVQVPNLQDPTRLKELLGKTAKLDFRMVDTNTSVEAALQGRAPPEREVLYGTTQPKTPYLIEKRVVVSGAELTDAQPGFDERTSEPIVAFRFNTSGARKFAQATQENVGKPFAIVLDNEVISAPVIREPILGGSGQISGSFTIQSSSDLASLLRAGALPVPLTIIEEHKMGSGQSSP